MENNLVFDCVIYDEYKDLLKKRVYEPIILRIMNLQVSINMAANIVLFGCPQPHIMLKQTVGLIMALILTRKGLLDGIILLNGIMPQARLLSLIQSESTYLMKHAIILLLPSMLQMQLLVLKLVELYLML